MNLKVTLVFVAAQVSSTSLSAQSLKSRQDPEFIKKVALRIDQQWATFYRRKILDVPKVTDDATFLRRALRGSPAWRLGHPR